MSGLEAGFDALADFSTGGGTGSKKAARDAAKQKRAMVTHLVENADRSYAGRNTSFRSQQSTKVDPATLRLRTNEKTGEVSTSDPPAGLQSFSKQGKEMIVVGSAREIRDWLDKKIKQNPPEADKRYCMTLQELAPASTPPVIKKSFAERSFDFYKSKQPAKLAPTPPVIKKSFAGRSLDFYKLKKQQAKLASTPPAPEGAGLFGGNPPESGPSAQPSPDGRDKSAHRPAVSGVIYGGIEKGALSKSQRRRINKKKAEQETIERSEHRKDVADEANSTNTVFGSTAGLSGRPGKPHAKTRAELDLDMEGCWAGP